MAVRVAGLLFGTIQHFVEEGWQTMKRTKTTTISIILVLVAGVSLILPAAGLADCPDDIVAYWKLDEASGSTYTDFIGGNDGTGSVDPTAVAGRVNGAQRFAATSGINVPASKAFNWGPTDSFSIEFWVKTDGLVSPGTNQVIIGRGVGAAGMFWWVGAEQTSGNAIFYLRDENDRVERLEGNISLTNGEWHHVVAVRNGATDENILYVDGVLRAGATETFAGFASSDDLTIGYVSNTFHFIGTIDEVALYDRELDLVNDVQAHFNSGNDYCGGSDAPTTFFAPFPDETVALWPLDEAGGTTYVDVFGGNDGTGSVDPTAVAGRVNGAQRFAATSGINVPASKAFNWGPTDSFSIEFWVKTDGLVSPGTNQVIIGRGVGAAGMFWWVGAEQTSGNAIFYLRDENDRVERLEGNISLTNGEWHHVVAVRNGATDENILYVDGVLRAGATETFAGFASSDDLTIGYVSNTFHFIGTIDEVALYDRELDLVNDVQAHIEAGEDNRGVQTLRPIPTANAGDDLPDVPELSRVTLSGSGSTYIGATITGYQWTQTDGPAVILSDPTIASPIFTAPDVDASTPLTFQLIVTASDGQSSNPDEVTVTVTDTATPPPPPPPAGGDGGGGGGCFVSSMF